MQGSGNMGGSVQGVYSACRGLGSECASHVAAWLHMRRREDGVAMPLVPGKPYLQLCSQVLDTIHHLDHVRHDNMRHAV